MTTQDRNRAVDNIQTGCAASLWVDRETGRLLILASVADTFVPVQPEMERGRSP